MADKMKKIILGERGAVEVVEAALVFPIVIFVVMIFFFLGNMFFQQAKVDAIAVRAAEKLATYYTNPMLQGGLPTSAENTTLYPYRYLFGTAGAEGKVKSFISDELEASGSDITVESVTCKIDNYIVYQKASVQINYSVELFPMELIGAEPIFKQSVGTATSAADPAEFIRNIDMIVDYADITGLTDKIENFVGEFMGN